MPTIPKMMTEREFPPKKNLKKTRENRKRS